MPRDKYRFSRIVSTRAISSTRQLLGSGTTLLPCRITYAWVTFAIIGMSTIKPVSCRTGPVPLILSGKLVDSAGLAPAVIENENRGVDTPGLGSGITEKNGPTVLVHRELEFDWWSVSGLRGKFWTAIAGIFFAFTQSRRHSLPSSCTTRLASSAVLVHAAVTSSRCSRRF